VITIALRIAFGILALAAVGLAVSLMTRLSWGKDALIAAVAVLAFAYFFERDDPAVS